MRRTTNIKETKMNYTIATLNQVHGNLELTIEGNGNKYDVALLNTETKETSSKEFNSLNEAFARFSKISEMIIKSYYDEKEKRSFLIQ